MQLLDKVEISGILDGPQLNGLSGTIQGFDEMNHAHIIRLHRQASDEVLSLIEFTSRVL